MNNDLVGEFNNQTFKQGTAILKIMYCNSKVLIVQHIPVKKLNKIEVFRMQNGYIIDTLTSVDIHEIVKIGGKVKEIYEGVFYFKVTPFLIYFFIFFLQNYTRK